MEKRIYQISLLLALFLTVVILTVSVFAKGNSRLPFTDVSTEEWYYSYVQTVYEKGWMRGIGSTEFSPDGTLTREMFVTVLSRIENIDQTQYTGSSFRDVESGSWYAAAVEWGAQNGIIIGYGNHRFGVGDPVTREQMATIIARYLNYKNITLKDSVNAVSGFKDAEKVSDYAKESLELMRRTGLIVGDDRNNFNPQSFAVRAEAVAIFSRLADAMADADNAATIPILLYHHLSETEKGSSTVLHPDVFEHQMTLLKKNGYTPVTFDDCIAFVEDGTPLPAKPVIITFDDGYASNYTYAFPVLKKYNFKATICVIGVSVGHDKYYKDTEFELTPHFGASEITEMISSGLITIASHTYDMHQWAPFETGTHIHSNMLLLDDESEADYRDELCEDIAQQNQLFSQLGLESSYILAYPGGQWTTLTNTILQENGYKVTLTTDQKKVNTIIVGQRQTLINMGRMGISAGTSDADLLAYLSSSSN